MPFQVVLTNFFNLKICLIGNWPIRSHYFVKDDFKVLMKGNSVQMFFDCIARIS